MSEFFTHPEGKNPIVNCGKLNSKSLQFLHANFIETAKSLIAIAVEQNINPVVIETKRSIRQHRENVKNGKSFSASRLSRHCFGLAIDIAPAYVLDKPNWEPENPLWEKLVLIGESLGLICGARWQNIVDKPHFQISAKAQAQVDLNSIVLWE